VNRSRLPRWAPALLATALLAGCTVGPSTRPPLATGGEPPATTPAAATPSSRPVGPGGAGQRAEPLDWQSCPSDVPSENRAGTAVTLECAELSVPLSYGRTGSSTIYLDVARARGTSTPARAPDLVVVLGGPGENGRGDIAEIAGQMPAAVLASRAIVTLDLRGSIAQAPSMACFSRDTMIGLLSPPIDPTNPQDAELVDQLSTAAAFDCGRDAGTSISEFSTTAAADDLDSLRSALGADRLQYLGRGYGATLGAEYAHRYPGRVARLILDSPSDPQSSLSDTATARAVALEAALDDFAAECSATIGGCPLGAKPRQAIGALIDDIGGSSSGGYLITGGSVLLLLSELLGRPGTWPQLGKALAAASGASGNPDQLGTLLERTVGVDGDHRLIESRLAYTCNDAAQRLTGKGLADAAAAARARAPMFGSFMVGQAALCGAWPTAVAPLGRLSGEGAPPILIAGAVKDPIAPYSGIKSVVSQLSAASLISWQSGSHGTFPGSTCIAAAVQSYLTKGTEPPSGELCPP
jgi:pimeloyl-ACP methyl ester carboxylesterase